ncbi:hypothetical protein FACS1894179_04210 [Bacteroidia bacterium]|nr:hypothetical protein FACS1894169_07560 [Bacteroidia bacterium]GHV39384.1 hypothetical protein FACS1894179_04210 [Bacteroidia bacterium]
MKMSLAYKYLRSRKYLLFFLLVCAQTTSLSIAAQVATKSITVKNSSPQAITDYTLEIPAKTLNLPLGNYVAVVEEKTVPVEIIENIQGELTAVLPIARIEANKTLEVTIRQGTADSYPKRTYAELSHKIGGHFEGYKYVGGYSWVKPNYITLPGDFRDHSYYIKYEGPGWESDKVAFRFYLDNRNGIDVFAKKTSEIVLPAVGVDGFDNYHNMADWGMDNMKVGKTLGLGSIAAWSGEKAVRVEKKDSVTCYIPADGKIRSQVKTIYYGWEANHIKCDLTSIISIDAGSRASHMELMMNRGSFIDIATGIFKDENAELIVKNDKNSTWSYIATFGKQSLNNDIQGLVVFARTKQIKEITGDDLNHVLVLTPENGYIEYYFMPTWELDKEPIATKEAFIECVEDVLNKLNHPLTCSVR